MPQVLPSSTRRKSRGIESLLFRGGLRELERASALPWDSATSRARVRGSDNWYPLPSGISWSQYLKGLPSLKPPLRHLQADHAHGGPPRQSHCPCQLQMGACHGHLPSTCTRIKSCAAAAANLQYPLKEFGAESRNEALSAGVGGWGRKGQDRSSDS